MTMRLHSLYRRPADGPDAPPEMVAERFSWPAFLFAPIWLLANGLWLWFAGWIALVAALAAASLWLGPDAAGSAYLLAMLLLGFEASNLRRARLERRGYLESGERFAPDPETAAIGWMRDRDASRSASA